MDRTDMDDAATLVTLLHDGKRSSSLRALLPGWDMLEADVPSRERLETAIAILVGSRLAEVDSSWGMRLTEQGVQLKRSVKGARGMREIPGAISDLLVGRQLSRATLGLPHKVFDAAREDYLDAAQRRAERRSPHRWWWPDPSRNRPKKAVGLGSSRRRACGRRRGRAVPAGSPEHIRVVHLPGRPPAQRCD
ncbi:hypothetical protein NicSoilC12_06770 [Arthrobacter sp. NicSoilC12]|nr:hypothetical protein NicSoilC12_06770 [Arthrobacter sp. NicSoilC12]